MENSKLFIDGKRSGYAPEQCGDTLTVGQLIRALQRGIEWGELSEDMPIYLCNDRGYTYGLLPSWAVSYLPAKIHVPNAEPSIFDEV